MLPSNRKQCKSQTCHKGAHSEPKRPLVSQTSPAEIPCWSDLSRIIFRYWFPTGRHADARAARNRGRSRAPGGHNERKGRAGDHGPELRRISRGGLLGLGRQCAPRFSRVRGRRDDGFTAEAQRTPRAVRPRWIGRSMTVDLSSRTTARSMRKSSISGLSSSRPLRLCGASPLPGAGRHPAQVLPTPHATGKSENSCRRRRSPKENSARLATSRSWRIASGEGPS